ncbi:MAG: cobalamin biosynthesis protein [Eubacterium sp.]
MCWICASEIRMVCGIPSVFVGNLISFFEKRLRRGRSERADLAGGVLLVILVTGISTAIPFGILFLCYRLWFWLGFAVEVYMCYTVLATKSLKTESMKVAEALEQEGLEAGRYAVSMIVGRDTKELTETGVVKAAVETVAENTSDESTLGTDVLYGHRWSGAGLFL